MYTLKILNRWVEEQQKKPLSKDYQRALNDISKFMQDISNQLNKDNGDMELEIAEVGDFGFSGFSGSAIDGFEHIVDYINRRTVRNSENKGKFLIEIKNRKLDLYEKFKK